MEHKFIFDNPQHDRLFNVMVQLRVGRGLNAEQIEGLEADAGQLGFSMEGDEVIEVTKKVRAYLQKEEPDSSW